jgi:hypothetical protein
MKNMIKYSNYFWFGLTLCMMIISGCSCSAPKPVPDPLARFHAAYGKVDQLIVTDYQNYIQTLSPEEKKYMGPTQFFGDDAGQHAIQIQIALYGTWWFHDLIYDKDNKRIKTIKYSPGKYRS